jgi:hypothetical protein
MAFISEAIPDEVLKVFDFEKFTGPMGKPMKFTTSPPKWVVDRERDAFLIKTGNGGFEPHQEFFTLLLQGKIIKFIGDVLLSEDERGNVITWGSPQLYIPDDLVDRRAEIVVLLKEALIAYGWLWRPATYTVSISL